MPRSSRATTTETSLRAFDQREAEAVAGWINGDDEAYRIAPRTPPPLDAGAIRSWRSPTHHQFMLIHCATGSPIGYGEVNLLNAQRREYWLGHLVIDPALRGRGYGTALTRRLLEFAFVRCKASAATLVVFQNNDPAIRSYRAAGMVDDGFEQHYFPAYGRQESLLRLRCTQWNPVRASAAASSP
ncbi:MAG: GNAT family N-acetyltransferase [Phycisphaerales bacterium]|nr:GNAT family N-acetyltransferase [Phycisphaerales bacterium]